MAFTLRPWGAFSLAAAASFAEGFPGTDAHHAHNELQFAWPVDEDWRTVAVALRQSREGVVRGELAGTPPSGLARRAGRGRADPQSRRRR